MDNYGLSNLSNKENVISRADGSSDCILFKSSLNIGNSVEALV